LVITATDPRTVHDNILKALARYMLSVSPEYMHITLGRRTLQADPIQNLKAVPTHRGNKNPKLNIIALPCSVVFDL
jgi:hypothetical protein